VKGKVLVTGTLFIEDKHLKQIEAAGYEVERLEKADATEEELITALDGKSAISLAVSKKSHLKF